MITHPNVLDVAFTATGNTAWSVGSAYCPRCGKPYIYVGDWFSLQSPICLCPRPQYRQSWTTKTTTIPTKKVGDSFDDWRRPEEDIWDELFANSQDVLDQMADNAMKQHQAGETTRLPAAWECPRCHTINAPHVNQCTCEAP